MEFNLDVYIIMLYTALVLYFSCCNRNAYYNYDETKLKNILQAIKQITSSIFATAADTFAHTLNKHLDKNDKSKDEQDANTHDNSSSN